MKWLVDPRMVHGLYSTAPICHGGGASSDPGAILVSWFWSKKDDPQQTLLDQFGLLFSSTKGRRAIFLAKRRPDKSTNTTCPGDLSVCHLGVLKSITCFEAFCRSNSWPFWSNHIRADQSQAGIGIYFQHFSLTIFVLENEGHQNARTTENRRDIDRLRKTGDAAGENIGIEPK